MIEVRQTETFRAWLADLRDRTAQAAIYSRLDRVAYGHKGDIKPVGDGVSELRIHVGAGYRVYLVERGRTLIVVLCGGDKGSQRRDIKRAREMAEGL